MAAILKKSVYISAGALIDESWIVTGADSLYTLHDLSRVLRVRLGSINYKKGGILSPVKLFHIHPLFDDNQPQYDVALIRLAEPVRLTPRINPIQMLKRLHDVVVSHFIVTGWMAAQNHKITSHKSTEIKRRRLLTVSHLHPTDVDDCSEELEVQGINSTGVMCLDTPSGSDPCLRDIGAPVVLNGILWGIISSWRSEDCDVEAGATFVTLVSHVDVSSWIHATIHSHKWTRKHVVDYDDNFI
ncbi:kallikrein-15-like [Colias croceus]|uniref:kallikrein-15-like n=1 Tax=Colias crocea TaxID=72248 RepID=UPI001E27F4D8|nr:kallikrein-15-like [Colias croceus]